MTDTVRVGVLDSGIDAAFATSIGAARAFFQAGEGAIERRMPVPSPSTHATSMAAVILGESERISLWDGQIFTGQFGAATTPAIVAAGIDWLVEECVDLINMSFGLRHDRAILRAACERAERRGVLLVAAAPARGTAVYPAAYPSVLSVCGDARCTQGQWSWLAPEPADVGTSPRPDGRAAGDQAQTDRHAGASVACARLSALVAEWLANGGDRQQMRGFLRERAHYIGRERR